MKFTSLLALVGLVNADSKDFVTNLINIRNNIMEVAKPENQMALAAA